MPKFAGKKNFKADEAKVQQELVSESIKIEQRQAKIEKVFGEKQAAKITVKEYERKINELNLINAITAKKDPNHELRVTYYSLEHKKAQRQYQAQQKVVTHTDSDIEREAN